MNEGYIIAGLLLLTAGMIDFLWTTLWLESGAGPITRCLSALLRGRAAAKSAVTTPKYGWSSAVMPDVSDMDQSILERVGFDLLE